MPSQEPRKDPGRAFKRIQELTPEQKAILHTMFYEGRGVPAIMKMFQQTLGLWTDVKENTLEKYLYRYKYDVVDKNMAMVIPKGQEIIPLQHTKEEIDVLEEVGQLVLSQKARVQKLMIREKDMPVLISSLGGEMKTLSGLIQQFADLSFDLGFVRRVPKTTKIIQDGKTTVVESDGKDAVQVSYQVNEQLEKAAATFFSAIDGVFESVQDATGD